MGNTCLSTTKTSHEAAEFISRPWQVTQLFVCVWGGCLCSPVLTTPSTFNNSGDTDSEVKQTVGNTTDKYEVGCVGLTELKARTTAG